MATGWGGKWSLKAGRGEAEILVMGGQMALYSPPPVPPAGFQRQVGGERGRERGIERKGGGKISRASTKFLYCCTPGYSLFIGPKSVSPSPCPLVFSYTTIDDHQAVFKDVVDQKRRSVDGTHCMNEDDFVLQLGPFRKVAKPPANYVHIQSQYFCHNIPFLASAPNRAFFCPPVFLPHIPSEIVPPNTKKRGRRCV